MYLHDSSSVKAAFDASAPRSASRTSIRSEGMYMFVLVNGYYLKEETEAHSLISSFYREE